MQRWTIQFRGRVQGVGFRYTARRIIDSRPDVITGYVRNRLDGSVELVLEAAETALATAVAEIRGAMAGHIDDVSVHKGAATGEFKEFEIRR